MRVLITTFFLVALSGCTALLVGGGPGSSLPDSREPAQVTEDSATTATVSSRLAADPILESSDIGVYTYANRVTLSGTVGSREARARAHEIAASVEGVTSVRNDIRVRGRR